MEFCVNGERQVERRLVLCTELLHSSFQGTESYISFSTGPSKQQSWQQFKDLSPPTPPSQIHARRIYGSPNVSLSRSCPDSPSGLVFVGVSSVDKQTV